jgi:hypothetical protein
MPALCDTNAISVHDEAKRRQKQCEAREGKFSNNVTMVTLGFIIAFTEVQDYNTLNWIHTPDSIRLRT